MNILKIFSGEQQGSIIEVNVGQNIVVGNDLAADIYVANNLAEKVSFALNLPDVEHITFSLSATEVLLQVDGVPLDSDQVYKLPVFFSFAAVEIGIGSAEQIRVWPSADFSGIEEVVAPFSILDLDKEEPSPLPASAEHNPAPDLLARWLKIIQLKATEFGELLNQKYSWMSKAVYAFGAIIVLLLLGLMISYGISAYQAAQIKQRLDLEEQLKQKFYQYLELYTNLSLIKSADKSHLIIQGLVAESKDKLAIQTNLADYAAVVQYNIITAPQALAQIRGLLKKHHMSNLRLNYDLYTQSINISGIEAYSDDIIEGAIMDISTQLAFINNLNFNIYGVEQVKDDFNLSMGELSSLLMVNYALSAATLAINVQGYLTNSQLEVYHTAISQFNQKYPEIVKISSSVEDIATALPFGIYGVFIGAPSYVITDQGQTVFIGGYLGKFKLINITENKITLMFHEHSFDLLLSQLGSVSNNFSDRVNRKVILKEELVRLRQALAAEQQQLVFLNRYANQTEAESNLKLLHEQIQSLVEDISAKNKDITELKETLNAE